MNFIEETHEEVEPVQVSIYVEGLPPYKQPPLDLKEASRQKELSKQLQEEARKAYSRVYPLGEEVILDIRYRRNQGDREGTKIIGGISDALRKIIYTEDSLVTEVHYSEEPGMKDEYWVEVRNKHTHTHDHGHHH